MIRRVQGQRIARPAAARAVTGAVTAVIAMALLSACGTAAAGPAPVPAAPAASSPAATPPAAAAPSPSQVPAAAGQICVSASHPLAAAQMSADIARTVAARKDSVTGLAASDPGLGMTCVLRPETHFYSASVIKVTILSALLRKIGGVGGLTATERSLATQMITQSSNDAATALWNQVGMTSMQAFLTAAGMSHTRLSTSWGLTRITPSDELRLLQLLSVTGPVLGPYARGYVLRLMADVVPGERWGVSAGAGAGVTVHIKNGWLPYPAAADWNVNSLGVFTGTGFSYQMAVLTAPAAGGQSEAYGIKTVQQAAGIINRGLAGLRAIAG